MQPVFGFADVRVTIGGLTPSQKRQEAAKYATPVRCAGEQLSLALDSAGAAHHLLASV